MAGCEVVVAFGALQTWPRIGHREGAITRGAAGDHRARRLVPASNFVLSDFVIAVRNAWISDRVSTLFRVMSANHRAGAFIPWRHVILAEQRSIRRPRIG